MVFDATTNPAFSKVPPEPRVPQGAPSMRGSIAHGWETTNLRFARHPRNEPRVPQVSRFWRLGKPRTHPRLLQSQRTPGAPGLDSETRETTNPPPPSPISTNSGVPLVSILRPGKPRTHPAFSNLNEPRVPQVSILRPGKPRIHPRLLQSQ